VPAADHVIDDRWPIYATDFQGFDKTMNARSAAGEQVELAPVALAGAPERARRLRSSRRAHGLFLDSLEFSRRVLTHSGVAEDAQD
jgi:hypothetical protein